MTVNWHIFQATAAVMGGDFSRKGPSLSHPALVAEVNKRFIELYRTLESLAERIDEEDAELTEHLDLDVSDETDDTINLGLNPQ